MATQPFPPVLVVVVIFAVVLGLPLGLYALLTRKQRQATQEIKNGANARGWRYRSRHWQGNPTAFRIDGTSANGLTWIMTSGNSAANERRWSALLAVRYPMLRGEVDFAILPRGARMSGSTPSGPAIPDGFESRLAAFSSTAAGAIHFLREARELPSGVSGFDAAYEVLSLPQQIQHSPVDTALTDQILHWPTEAIALHSIVAWRDPFGFHFHAHLAGPPNWATVSHFLDVADSCSQRIPPAAISSVPPGLVERLVARFLPF